MILERIRNKPVVLVASYFKQNALVLVVKPEIKRPSDLRNKNIMIIEDELNNTSLAVMIKDSGLNSRDYNLVKHDFKLNKFINNEVDAFSAFTTSQLFELDQLGIQYNILNPSSFGIYSYDVKLFTCEKNVKENFNKVKKFVEATNKGWEYAFANKNEIVNLIFNKYSKEKNERSFT